MLEHFPEDAAHSPHVNSSGVLAQLKQKLRWTIPSCDDECGVFSCGLAASMAGPRRVVVIRPCQAKIGNLENSAIVDE
jgi:hypothetical protein